MRHVTRYGLPTHNLGSDMFAIMKHFSDSLLEGQIKVDLETGTRRARAALMLLLGLPGSTYLYQSVQLVSLRTDMFDLIEAKNLGYQR